MFFLLIILFLTYSLCNKTEISSKQTECIADYILLSKNIKTEIFAENIDGKWTIQRGISKETIKNLNINKLEMAKFMGEKYAKNCLENLFEYFTENKVIKCLNKKKNYLNSYLKVKKLFIAINKNYLILSEEYQKKLGK